MIVFDGESRDAYMKDLWSFDVQKETWQQFPPDVLINPLAGCASTDIGNRKILFHDGSDGHKMVYDGEDTVVLFEGYGGSAGLRGDTWIYEISKNK